MLNVEYQAAATALMAAAREADINPVSELAISTAVKRLVEYGLDERDAYAKMIWAATRFQINNRDEATERIYKRSAHILGRA